MISHWCTRPRLVVLCSAKSKAAGPFSIYLLKAHRKEGHDGEQDMNQHPEFRPLVPQDPEHAMHERDEEAGTISRQNPTAFSPRNTTEDER